MGSQRVRHNFTTEQQQQTPYKQKLCSPHPQNLSGFILEGGEYTRSQRNNWKVDARSWLHM